jgi:NADPH-dependent curcumin reductase CurA
MSETVNRKFVLAQRPKGALEESDFQWREEPVPEPGDGEALVRNLYLSLDPANRGWINEVPTYRPPVPVGGVMAGLTIGRVLASRRDDLKPGDMVEADGGWQDYALLGPRTPAVRLPDDRDPLAQMSVLGLTGKTAYWGLLDIGRPKAGETVLVSAAAGAVGSITGQIAKIQGCRAVGVAGSDEKCAWITDELGLDAAINYKSENVAKAIRQHCPDGIDIYFDNVGGEVLQAALFHMNMRGRIVCCGVVSQYDTATPAPGPHGVPGLLVVKRLCMEGFLVLDYEDRRAEAEQALAAWVEEGRLAYKVDLIEGLENSPAGLIGLLHGANIGKRLIRIADDIE